MPGDEPRDVPAQRVAKDAGSTEMDTAEDARIGDFGNGTGETGERTSARTRLGGDCEGGVISKLGSGDERRGATDRGVRRGILWKSRSAGFEKVQPRFPRWGYCLDHFSS